MIGTPNRPHTAQASPAREVPHYMRSKTDTLHHSRIAAEAQQQQVSPPSASLPPMLPRPKAPGVFCSTYEVSYSPLRERPEVLPANKFPSSTNNAQADDAYKPQLPPNVNPASLREKQRYLHHKSRDAMPHTNPSQFIIDLQHHMRNTSKAEFSRNVRKTEPPTLERIFGTDEDNISTREIIRRHNERLRLEDEERVRHRSLLYNKAEYAARHGATADATSGPTARPVRRAQSAAVSTSPLRERLFYSQKQFDKFAPDGWDRPVRVEHEQRIARLAGGPGSLDWASDTLSGSQRSVNRLHFNQNKEQAAGIRSDKADASRRQYVESPHELRDVPPSHTEQEMAEFRQETERQNSSYHPPGIAPTSAAEGSKRNRTLPKHIRDKLSDERTPNEVVMKYVVDPVLRMELVEKQRHWRSEYQRLRDAYGQELDKKSETMNKIRELQAEKNRR